MKKLKVIAAGFGSDVLSRAGCSRFAGLTFETAPSVFPAVTCVAQASLRTGSVPAAHGLVSNGHWFDALAKPLFWEQSARLVRGPRVWDARRAAGAKVGLFFLQQSLGESVDFVVSPAPIHKHGGGMVMGCYAKPQEASAAVERETGTFPLWRYWGPLASPKVGRACIAWFKAFSQAHGMDEAWLYLPTLDYSAQKHGPGSGADRTAFAEFVRQLEELARFCDKDGWELSVTGDYDIASVTSEPCLPNVVLRERGLFRVRSVKGRAYPDFYASSAFAMCDHEICVVYGPAREQAAEVLLATGRFVRPEGADAADTKGALVLLAERGSWCDYRWWTDRREAPDFAAHVDIHNKPGFDPRELFFFCRGTVRGTHGRRCAVARSEGACFS